MKVAFTFGRKHGGKELELVTGAEVPVHKQLEQFKEFQRVESHKELAEVHLFIASPSKSRRLSTPAQARKSAEQKAAAIKAAKELKAKAEKPEPKAEQKAAAVQPSTQGSK